MKTKDRTTHKRQFLLLPGILAVIIAAGGSLYYRHQGITIREQKYTELSAIADLKIHQLVQWREERIADAYVYSSGPFLTRDVEQWLHNKTNNALKEQLKKHLAIPQKENGYESIFIASTAGDLLLSAGSALHIFDPVVSEKIRDAAKYDTIINSDFYYCKTENTIHYDIIAPLRNEKNLTIAMLVLRINPYDYLYPFIQSWPTPSKSSQTLIIRKDGDSVIFLNELRFHAGSALSLKIPLTRKEVPAVQSVLGFEGIFEGKDYRGVEVLSDDRHVPGTTWSMVAKVDRSEIYSDLYEQAIFISLFTVLLMLVCGIGVMWIYHYRQRNIYRTLWQTQEEFRTTLLSIGDAVIATDKRGRVQHLNYVAEQLTGWKEKDAKNKLLENVFHIVNEDTRVRIENPVELVLKEGHIVGLANHTLLISKEGRETPIADSGSPIRDDKNEIIGVVLVFRDQTKERASQKLLQDSEMRYRRLFEAARDGILILNAETGVIQDVNPFLIEMLGFSHEKFCGKMLWELGFFKDIDSNKANLLELQEKEYIRYEDLPMETSDGRKIDVELVSNVYLVDHHKIIQCNIRDITERKRADEVLLKNESRLRAILNATPFPIALIDFQDNNIEFWSDSALTLFGHTAPTTQEWYQIAYPDPSYRQELINRWKLFLENARLSGQTVNTGEYRITCRDGSVRICELYATILLDKLVVTFNDITERKRAEGEILNLNRTYAVLSTINELIVRENNMGKLLNEVCEIAVQDGKFRMSWIGMLDEKTGKVDPVASAGVTDGYLENLHITISDTPNGRGPTGIAIREGNIVVCDDIEHDDRMIPWKERALALGYGSSAAIPLIINDKAIGVINFYSGELNYFHEEEVHLLEELAVDVSFALKTIEIEEQRRQMEEKLEHEQHLITVLMESIPDHIYFKDKESRFIRINKSQAQIFGLRDPNEVIGKTDFDFFLEEHAQKAFQDEQAIIKTGKSIIDVEEKETWRNGSITWVSTTKIPLRNSQGQIIGTLGVSRDITERKRADVALRQAEAQYRLLADHIKDTVWLMDMNLKTTYISPSVEKLRGYTLKELEQLPLDQQLAPASFQLAMDAFSEEMLKVMADPAYFILRVLELEFYRKDGTTYWSENRFSLIRDENGSPLSIMGEGKDITERKRAEEALRQSEKNLSNAMKIALLSTWEYDIVSDRFTFNDQFYSIMHTTVEKEGGYTMSYALYAQKFIHADDRAIVGLEIQKALETADPDYHMQLDHRIKRSDGEIDFISVNIHVMKDANGRTVGMYGVNQDITERKRTEEALMKNEALLRTAVENLPLIFYMIDQNGNFKLSIGAGLKRLGLKPNQVVDQSVYEVYKEYPEIVVSINKSLEGESVTFESNVAGNAFVNYFTPLTILKGTSEGIVGVAMDVTEQKILQKELLQSQKMESVGTLAGGIAHDFNNILGIILAYSSMLERAAGDKKKISEYSSVISQAVNRGAGLVRQILTFARKTDVTLVPMSFIDLLHELISMLRQTFPKVITFTEIVDTEIQVINADRTQIHQVLLNLCVNARDAMPNGGSITFKAEKQTKAHVQERFPAADQDSYIIISVIDTGTGMNEATRRRIFDPFYTTKEQGKGTGLGLAVVYGVVQSHHGFIDVESEVGRGTTFRLYFPIPPTSEHVSDIPSNIESFSTGGIETILLVEDEEALIEMVRLLLESKGYNVFTAQDGKKAVEMFKQHKNEIDIVLTDMGLPGMTGVDEFKILKEIAPNVKVIFASGFFEPVIKSDLYIAGAKGFIQKPYSPGEILQKIREVLDTKA